MFRISIWGDWSSVWGPKPTKAPRGDGTASICTHVTVGPLFKWWKAKKNHLSWRKSSTKALGRLSPSHAWKQQQGRRQRGSQWCPTPLFEIGAPPFHVWPTGSCIHPILYFKNVPPPGFWPLLVFASPCCYILATGLSSRCISSKRQRSLKCVFNKFFSCHPDKLPGRDLGTVRAKTFQEKTTKICKIL